MDDTEVLSDLRTMHYSEPYSIFRIFHYLEYALEGKKINF